MSKRLVSLLTVLILMLALTACGGSDKLDGVYVESDSIYFGNGYALSDDGTAIYYETHWGKLSDGPHYCDPDYYYGTYTVEEKAITITLSGADEVTGVIMDDGQIVIDGIPYTPKTESYYSAGDSMDHTSWAELDAAIGL